MDHNKCTAQKIAGQTNVSALQINHRFRYLRVPAISSNFIATKANTMLDIKAYAGQFEAYLKEQQFTAPPKRLYDPVNYIMSLGGKRLRPLLVLVAHALYNKQVDGALPVAYAVELFHNFTLVHDDIMDEAELRRGQATVHHKYGDNAAILSGDVMLIQVYEVLRQVPHSKLPEVLAVFNKAAIEVCEGQQYDMDFEDRDSVEMPEYLNMIRCKTAVLLAASLQLGGIMAGVDAGEQQKLFELGLNMGLAFQIQDDYLDSFGDPKYFGKAVGGDIKQNKKTFLLIKALELADTEEKQALEKLLANSIDPDEKVIKVKQLFVQLGVDTLAQQQQAGYFDASMGLIDDLQAEATDKEALKAFTTSLFQRQH